MNIDDLTIGQAKELSAIFGGTKEKHPLDGQKVVAVLPHGFIHYGVLHDSGGRFALSEASNLRYWVKRDGGLPEFAAFGPKEDDRIDKIGVVHFDSALFFYPCGCWA